VRREAGVGCSIETVGLLAGLLAAGHDEVQQACLERPDNCS
jgi:hypothetical protein